MAALLTLVACSGNKPPGGTAGGSGATAGGSGTAGSSATGGGTAGTAGGSAMGGGTGTAGGAVLPTPDGGTLVAGETCLMPRVLMPGATFRSTTAGLTDDYNFEDVGICRGSVDNTADAVFQVTAPAGQRVTVDVTSEFDAIVHLVRAPAANCGTTMGGTTTGIVCLVSEDWVYARGTESVSYFNTGTTSLDLFVIVDGFEAGDEGAFNIVSRINTMPPQGDVCATAIPLGATLTAQTWADFGADYSPGPLSCRFVSGPDRLYKIDVPALSKLTVVATPMSDDIALNIIEGPEASCAAPLACVARAEEGDDGEPETAVFNNTLNVTRTAYVHVSVFRPPTPGETFSLSATLSAVTPPPPAGDQCGTATPIDAGTLTAQTTTGFYPDYDVALPNTGCGRLSVAGPDRVYAINVGSGQTLTATVTPGARTDSDAGWDPAVYLLGGAAATCTPVLTQCLAGADVGVANDPDTVRYTNDAGTARSVFVIVDTYYDEAMTYELRTTLTP
ncbi:MAG: hypothetical protein JNK82_04460 [Myxococcaceae bacterium]|nr:hypothetical protein [Myxococcaceae bacterium]